MKNAQQITRLSQYANQHYKKRLTTGINSNNENKLELIYQVAMVIKIT